MNIKKHQHSKQEIIENYRQSWWRKLPAAIALLNLILVLFNLSYLPLRDTYLQYTPTLVKLYDPVKAIEPHPDTETYLATVEQLKTALPQAGLKSDSTAKLLNSLQEQSLTLIAENPFLDADKPATFAKLKRRMEYQMNTRSSIDAFTEFWSKEYLADFGFEPAISFWEHKIEPLLKSNFYRHIDANGTYIDNFWHIDLFFVICLAIDYLSGTWWLARQRENIGWGNMLLRHWYDAIFLLPFWRWLRVIPVGIRLHKSKLINLGGILAQITHEPVAYLSNKASMFAVVQLLNQSQEAITGGELVAELLESKPNTKDDSEIDRILDRLIGLTIYKVLPQVQPDVEALLQHSLREAIQESDFYRTLQQVPGIANLPDEMTQNLGDYLAKATYDVLANSYGDAQGRALFDSLSQNFTQTLRQELRDRATQSEMQLLLSQLLEKLKSRYVRGTSNSNAEATLAEAEELESSDVT
ncbi:hypothetical protein [Myxosarcina sp. GI1]|uniref:hypothetical protein n=1 Tax=Myxosarcina sp. GI1 TaxID=1541065 RepID=UPI001C104183|nr:hypothetical protein [Myxosarcina sp. GI1]